jgi:hypothetical protein
VVIRAFVLSGELRIRSFIAVAIARKTWKRAIGMETDKSTVDVVCCGFGYTFSQNLAKRGGETLYAVYWRDSMYWTNSVVRVSASNRLGRGVVARARLRSVKLERDDPGVGLSAWLAAKMPFRGRRGAGANGSNSSSTSGMGDMADSCPSLPPDIDEAEVLLEWPRLIPAPGLSCSKLLRAINSQEGAACGSIDAGKGFPPAMCCAIDPNCIGADVGGTSGEDCPDARVVPDHNEGTSELGEATFGSCSLLIEIAGMLPPAEKLARSKSSAEKELETLVSRTR